MREELVSQSVSNAYTYKKIKRSRFRMKQYEMYNIQAKHFKQFISKLFARFEKISLMKGEFARNKVYHHFCISNQVGVDIGL